MFNNEKYYFMLWGGGDFTGTDMGLLPPQDEDSKVLLFMNFSQTFCLYFPYHGNI